VRRFKIAVDPPDSESAGAQAIMRAEDRLRTRAHGRDERTGPIDTFFVLSAPIRDNRASGACLILKSWN